ncbi:MAG: S9 family peptidase [Gemmatimonadetes bacterium]|nr:S9 family peptidase [Gemmatimonadota bacterium]
MSEPRIPIRFSAALLVAGLAFPSVSAARQAPAASRGRALEIEDFYRMKSVGSPQISPNGQWVAYTVSTRIEETNTDRGEVWLAAADGSGAPRRVSRDAEDAGSPTWLDDGSLRYAVGRAAFVFDPARPDAAAAAAPERMPGAPSPDGRFTALIRPTPPPARDRTWASDFERRHDERFKGVEFDWLNFQRDGAPFPVPDARDPVANPPSEIFMQPSQAADAVALTRLGLQPRDVSWSPDGRTLLFLADTEYRNELRYARSDVFTAAVESGEVVRLTHEDGIENRSPRWSPDGARIAWVRSWSTNRIIREKRNHGGPTDLYVMAAGGGSMTNLTPDWPLQAGTPMWSPDGRWIYFTAQTGGASHLFRVSSDGGPVEQVTRGERRITGLSIDRGFRRMAYLVGHLDAPPEVHVASIDGSNERTLTRIHESFLAEVAPGRGETVRFRSADGTPIEGFLLYPHGYSPSRGPYPLIVSSHGGPHSASGYDFDFKLQYFAANGYFVLETNFRSSTGYGEDFLWATWGAWGTQDGQDVMAGVDHVIANYPVDPDRVGHTGHSYGGFMTNWLITRYPDRFAAAISGAGISNWVSDYGTADIARTKETEFFGYPWEDQAREIMIRQSPLTYAGRVRTPTLFVHGEVDQRVPYEEAEQMYTALKKIGVPARMIQYADMPHGIRGHWNNVHRMIHELKWWEQWLKPRT